MRQPNCRHFDTGTSTKASNVCHVARGLPASESPRRARKNGFDRGPSWGTSQYNREAYRAREATADSSQPEVLRRLQCAADLARDHLHRVLLNRGGSSASEAHTRQAIGFPRTKRVESERCMELDARSTDSRARSHEEGEEDSPEHSRAACSGHGRSPVPPEKSKSYAYERKITVWS